MFPKATPLWAKLHLLPTADLSSPCSVGQHKLRLIESHYHVHCQPFGPSEAVCSCHSFLPLRAHKLCLISPYPLVMRLAVLPLPPIPLTRFDSSHLPFPYPASLRDFYFFKSINVFSIFVASLQALRCNVYDVLTSFHFQLFQLICFLLLLLVIFILPLSLATAFSALIPLLLPSQGLFDLPCCNSFHDFLYHLPKNVPSPPSSAPGLRSPCPGSQHLLQCHPAARSTDGWSGLCTPCSSPISEATKVSGSQIPWVLQPGNTAGSCILLTQAQAAPAGLHKAAVKGPGAA